MIGCAAESIAQRPLFVDEGLLDSLKAARRVPTCMWNSTFDGSISAVPMKIASIAGAFVKA